MRKENKAEGIKLQLMIKTDKFGTNGAEQRVSSFWKKKKKLNRMKSQYNLFSNADLLILEDTGYEN